MAPSKPETHSNSVPGSGYLNYTASASLSVREQRRSEDGFNWRKYGQKQVKGSENPQLLQVHASELLNEEES